MVRTCLECGKEFETIYKHQLCCSAECRRKRQLTLMREYSLYYKMGLRKPRFEFKKATLCWQCEKSVTEKCTWSQCYKPVEGWTAIPTQVKMSNNLYETSYCVISCPEFVRG